MLPFDTKPWAKTLAAIVICLSFAGAAALALYFSAHEELHIPEVVGIVLLLLTFIPPNAAILLRKAGDPEPFNAHLTHHPSQRTR